MGRQRQGDEARRDLPPEDWRRLANERGRLPERERVKLAELLVERTGLSRATIYRRLSGHFQRRPRGRRPITLAEQRQLVIEALERFHGRISPTELWMDVLGAPAVPSLQTVRRIVREWREAGKRRVPDVERLVSTIVDRPVQPPLPLGPDRPTMFAAAKARPASDAMAKLTEALDAAEGRR